MLFVRTYADFLHKGDPLNASTYVLASLFALTTLNVSAAQAADCAAKASVAWPEGGKGVVAEATSSGPRCGTAKLGLVLRGAGGEVLFNFDATADAVMPFVQVKSKTEMQAALASWIADARTQMPTTAKLPNWKQGQEQPSDGEFPFYPDDAVKRAEYLALRAAKRPMFCFVQGMESLSCLVIGADGKAKTIGAQSFPG